MGSSSDVEILETHLAVDFSYQQSPPNSFSVEDILQDGKVDYEKVSKWVSYDTISDEDASDPLKEFSKEEVWKTIINLSREKTPDPYGFNIAFFQHFCSTLKGEVMGLFSEFHSKGVFEKSLNATFISLIPKVARTNDISKFRPI